MPRGFRPVRLTTFQQQPTVTQSQSNKIAPTLDTALNNSTSSNHNVNNNNNNNITSANNNNQQAPSTSINDHSHPHPSNLDQDLGPLSPSTISEISIETSDTTAKQQRLSPPSSPQLKYWTLPRNISIGSNKDADRTFGKLERGEIVGRIETNQGPPSNAKLVYESPSSKYFTLPVKTSSSSEKPRSHSVPAVPKYPGIGPVTENGIPLALRSVSSNSFLARRSYSLNLFLSSSFSFFSLFILCRERGEEILPSMGENEERMHLTQ